MKKIIVCILFFLSFGYSFGQEYLISFSAINAAKSIDSIKVENVTQSKSIIIEGSDLLQLQKNVTVDVLLLKNYNSCLRIYPNPMREQAKVDFFTPVSGNASIAIFDLTGRKIFSLIKNFDVGMNSFAITGLGKGVYSVSIHSKAYSYNGKIVSCSENASNVGIGLNGFSNNYSLSPELKSAKATIKMQYNKGDQLKYTAYSGVYRTIIPDVPTENKTIIFKFAECKDADNNVYPLVQLGEQLWMAENLKTITYNDKMSISLETDDFIWENMTSPAYCWYDNDQKKYGDQYGALYNWYAVDTKKICPAGWHVPSDDEWTKLSDYLIANGYGYLGTGADIAKSMATTWGWDDEDTESGNVGCNADKNNTSGFSGPPGGARGGRVSLGKYGCYNVGERGQWWSSTQNNKNAFTRHMFYYGSDLVRAYSGKSAGLSVRCVLTENN